MRIKGWLRNLNTFLRRKECPYYAQFAKYVICGNIAVAVDATAFYLLAWLVFPCLQAGDPAARLLSSLGFAVRQVSEDVLIRNYWIIKIICFFLSNGTVYVLNALYVFEGGRHHRLKEVLLFFGITLVIFLSGTWLGAFLISHCGWQTTYTYVFMLAVGVVANYTCRKFLIFKR